MFIDTPQNESTTDRVVNARRAGLPYKEIAAELGCSSRYVALLVAKVAPELAVGGPPAMPLSPPPGPPPPPMTPPPTSPGVYGPPPLRVMAALNLRRQGHTRDEVSAHTAYTPGEVNYLLSRWAPDLVQRHPTKAQRDEAVRRYLAHISTKEALAEQNGVSVGTITNWIRKSGSTDNHRGRFDHAEVVALYATGDYTVRALADRFGVSYQRIHQVIRERSLVGVRRRKVRENLEAAATEVLDVWKEGADIGLLADQVGLSPATLRRAIREVHPEKREAPNRTCNFDALIQMYRNGMSEITLAAIFEMTQSNVSSIVHRHAPDAVEARRSARRASVPEEFRKVGPARGRVDPLKVVTALRAGADREELRQYVGISGGAMMNILRNHAPDLISARGWPKGRRRA